MISVKYFHLKTWSSVDDCQFIHFNNADIHIETFTVYKTFLVYEVVISFKAGFTTLWYFNKFYLQPIISVNLIFSEDAPDKHIRLSIKNLLSVDDSWNLGEGRAGVTDKICKKTCRCTIWHIFYCIMKDHFYKIFHYQFDLIVWTCQWMNNLGMESKILIRIWDLHPS